jgi:hypothetical protein
MRDASSSAGDYDPRWRQHNTAIGGSVYATQGGGNIVFAGRPDESKPVREREATAAEPIRVLLFAANPSSTARLAIDEEARQITERLRLSQDRDAFRLITCWAVRPMDLHQYLHQHNPHIVHFSGHGDRTGDILLSAGDGTDRPVTTDGLADLFRAMNGEIRVVVLNACYSAAQALEIGRYVDYVIGMRAPITDEAATIFAASFYSALGFRRSIPQAYEEAVAVLRLHGPAGRHIPELLTRRNANPKLTGQN